MSSKSKCRYTVVAACGGTPADEYRVPGRIQHIGNSLRSYACQIVPLGHGRPETQQPDIALTNDIGVAGAGASEVSEVVEQESALRRQGLSIEEAHDILGLGLGWGLRGGSGNLFVVLSLDDDLAAVGSNGNPE